MERFLFVFILPLFCFSTALLSRDIPAAPHLEDAAGALDFVVLPAQGIYQTPSDRLVGPGFARACTLCGSEFQPTRAPRKFPRRFAKSFGTTAASRRVPWRSRN
ncbi:MAG: hypothetical protein DME19_20215 [Verrucomicrobia bacterium]|nr:MAG: hypothetical protein DME19_20215 [Verrucomicrobiota bacterium]